MIIYVIYIYIFDPGKTKKLYMKCLANGLRLFLPIRNHGENFNSNGEMSPWELVFDRRCLPTMITPWLIHRLWWDYAMFSMGYDYD